MLAHQDLREAFDRNDDMEACLYCNRINGRYFLIIITSEIEVDVDDGLLRRHPSHPYLRLCAFPKRAICSLFRGSIHLEQKESAL